MHPQVAGFVHAGESLVPEEGGGSGATRGSPVCCLMSTRRSFRRKPTTACPIQSLPAVKAGAYTRISSDPSGERAGVDRQRADCEGHCLARGWEVVEVSCDNDASAYGRKPRLAYERMLAAVESSCTPIPVRFGQKPTSNSGGTSFG